MTVFIFNHFICVFFIDGSLGCFRKTRAITVKYTLRLRIVQQLIEALYRQDLWAFLQMVLEELA